MNESLGSLSLFEHVAHPFPSAGNRLAKLKRETQNQASDGMAMADEALTTAWEKAEKAIGKGKGESALSILREADSTGQHATTLRLAGHGTWLVAKDKTNRTEYRKAASLLRDARKANPKDKKTDRLYNDLLNEMQDKGISETTFPRLINDGTPTPAGAVAILVAMVVVLGGVNVANSPGTTTDVVELNLTWGDGQSGTVVIDLHPGDAPIHVENFKALVNNGNYDGTAFHRVIDDFMIQGGDFTRGDGTGGHAANFYDLCNGQPSTDPACGNSGDDAWTIPDEADNGLLHESCTISMAKTSAADTGGSQFFLIPEDSTPNWLDGVHTVFGTITDGCDHVTAISEVDTGDNDRPMEDVRLVSATFVGSQTEDPWYRFW